MATRISHIACQTYELGDHTNLLVVEVGDSEADLIDEIGLSPLVNPLDGARYGSPAFNPWWDGLEDQGGWYVCTITVGNSGFAYELLIQDAPGADPELLSLCHAHAD
ncbi:MAG: hypothetical protein EOP21_05680 [Hyphomicrobiales bacterium]|nr:MAG: hypothetical protein EOP21_05680 [Hyphomicrobiales bacterium]